MIDRLYFLHICSNLHTFLLQPEVGTLKLTGYLRGKNLSVNSLIHLPGWGDFQMSQIDGVSDPYPLFTRNERKRRNTMVSDFFYTQYTMGQVTINSKCMIMSY